MRYRKLGSSDLSVSAVGLGTNNFGGRITDCAESARVDDEGIDVGVNLIDLAISYGGGESEVHVGHATHDRRDKVLIATKFRVEVPEGKSLAQHMMQAHSSPRTNLAPTLLPRGSRSTSICCKTPASERRKRRLAPPFDTNEV